MQKSSFRLIFIMITIIIFNEAFASSHDDLNDIESLVNQPYPGIHVKQGIHGEIFIDKHLANNSFIIGHKAIAVIDTGGSKSEGVDLLRTIRKLSDLPITHVINTHVHPDHILGNAAFRSEQTKFVGHKNLPRAIRLFGPTYIERLRALRGSVMSEEDLVPPDILVENELIIDLGGRSLRINTVKQAHTDNDLTIYDTQTGTLWLGDLLFVGHIPVLGGSGSVNGWLNFLEALTKKGGSQTLRLIPGHGNPVKWTDEAISKQQSYLSEMRRQVRQWLTDDKPLSQAINGIGKQVANDWPMAKTFHKRNISYMYSELEWE